MPAVKAKAKAMWLLGNVGGSDVRWSNVTVADLRCLCAAASCGRM